MKNLLFLLICVVMVRAFDDATVPNTFSAGTRAVAGDVNENFDSLKTAHNRTVDTIEIKFIRFTDLTSGDTTLTRLQVDTFTVDTANIADLKADTVHAFNLAGKLTAGSTEIEGSTFDINGGDISAVTISGGLTWSAAQDMNDQTLTNVDINSGAIDGVTIGAAVAPTVTDLGTVTTCNIDGGTIAGVTIDGSLTWSASQNLNDQDITNLDCNSGAIDGTIIGAVSAADGTFAKIVGDSLQLSSGSWLHNYVEGSFACTLTNQTTTVTGTAYYVRIGDVVTIDFNVLSGTNDNSTTIAVKGFPSAIRRTTGSLTPCIVRVRDDGTWQLGVIYPDGDNEWSVQQGDASNFTNATGNDVEGHFSYIIR